MPGKKPSGHKAHGAADRHAARALRRLGGEHSSEDCRELVARLKAQAECLEEILADIRQQIDAIECDEILDHIREELFEANE